MASPITDLAGLTLEVNHLERALTFYQSLFGLPLLARNGEHGTATLKAGPQQTLTLWKPLTRQPMTPWLEPLHPRGAAHLHYAWQILEADLDLCKELLDAHGVVWQEINLGTPERPDLGLYFFDPFGHGLELRCVDPSDPRSPRYPPRPRLPGEPGLPVMGLREVALAFGDYPAMLERLPRAYEKEQGDRDFAQFTLGPDAEADGNGTPRRWLYAWDPQVGLADMMGGDHVLVEFYADVPAVLGRVRQEGLPFVQGEGGLAVRDPEGHVFVFREGPA
jgi:catechol 2,3-dioxygenase-like lactoylglutathione lyase family enzyme